MALAGRIPGVTRQNESPMVFLRPGASSAEHTTPSNPQSRAKPASRVTTLVVPFQSDVAQITPFHAGEEGNGDELVKPVGTASRAAESIPAPERMDIHHPYAHPRRRLACTRHSAGNIVKLQIEENLEP